MENRVTLPVVEPIKPRVNLGFLYEHVFDTSHTKASNGLAESTPVDDHPLMGPVGDRVIAFGDAELECDLATGDCKYFGGSRHGRIQFGGLHMMQLSMHANRRLAVPQILTEGGDRSLLGEGKHPRCRQHRHITGSVGDGGIPISDYEGYVSSSTNLNHRADDSGPSIRYREPTARRYRFGRTRSRG